MPLLKKTHIHNLIDFDGIEETAKEKNSVTKRG